MQDFIPPQPANSFRITLDLLRSEDRLDNVLLSAVKQQDQNVKLKEISRVKFKELFKSGKVYIKGQKAKPNSAVNKGVTYVDILGN
ncbi:MAG: hypothetical protein K2X47_09640 [Bdellovibrionales bacterium]|nr:hypothetical protein [Bdellovibrionales bacterium]